MLDLAQHGKWDELHQEAHNRQLLLEKLFEKQQPKPNVSEAEQVMKMIKKTDEAILKSMNSAKLENINAAVDLQKTQKAIQQYQVHAKN
jgi:hypothetical protein